MLEREYKWMLSKEAFEKTLKIFRMSIKDVSESSHINYYYDTDIQSFRKIHTTVRMRYENGQITGTVKKHNNYPESTEDFWTEGELPGKIDIEWRKLFLQGEMTTRRTKFKLSEGITLFFDESIYLGKTDYELELEFNCTDYTLAHHWKSVINTYLENIDLQGEIIIDCGNCKHKSERFFEEKEKVDKRKTEFYDRTREYAGGHF